MNNLICGTVHKEKVVKWKVDRDMFGSESEDIDLLGRTWHKVFCNHSLDLELKKGVTYSNNRQKHCTFQAFNKMYNQIENISSEIGIQWG
jgi:hypothetical protein